MPVLLLVGERADTLLATKRAAKVVPSEDEPGYSPANNARWDCLRLLLRNPIRSMIVAHLLIHRIPCESSQIPSNPHSLAAHISVPPTMVPNIAPLLSPA